jgi:hypothetical protein
MSKEESMSKALRFLNEVYPSTIDMFDTENDTDRWVLAVDGLFGFVASPEVAKEAFDSVGHIDDSAFGSIWIIKPHWKPIDRFDKSKPLKKISDFKSIDILSYVAKYPERKHKKYMLDQWKEGDIMPAKERLRLKREAEHSWDFLFGE